MIKRFLIFLIKCYQKWISPLLGRNCRFTPSCSQYAVQAIEIHGAAKGTLLAAWRILRCNPLGRPGRDPVPPKGKWRNDPPTPLRHPKTDALDYLAALEDAPDESDTEIHAAMRTACPTQHKK